MNYQSIFATTPRNEEELVALEKETQQLLLKTLERSSMKPNEVTVVWDCGSANSHSELPDPQLSRSLFGNSIGVFSGRVKKVTQCLATVL